MKFNFLFLIFAFIVLAFVGSVNANPSDHDETSVKTEFVNELDVAGITGIEAVSNDLFAFGVYEYRNLPRLVEVVIILKHPYLTSLRGSNLKACGYPGTKISYIKKLVYKDAHIS